MIGRRSFQPSTDSSNREEFDRLFIQRVHFVVYLGYKCLEPARYAVDQETAITGDLASAIEIVLEEASESWMRFFRVYDDPPVNDPSTVTPSKARRGRSRRRVDIKIDSSEVTPYTRFHFEAKRLGKEYPAANYLGEDGLGRFLDGSYAINDCRAGMLGYIQQDDEGTWATNLDAAIAKDAPRFNLTSGGSWLCCPILADLPFTYTTCHNRVGNSGTIRLYHILLRFC